MYLRRSLAPPRTPPRWQSHKNGVCARTIQAQCAHVICFQSCSVSNIYALINSSLWGSLRLAPTSNNHTHVHVCMLTKYTPSPYWYCCHPDLQQTTRCCLWGLDKTENWVEISPPQMVLEHRPGQHPREQCSGHSARPQRGRKDSDQDVVESSLEGDRERMSEWVWLPDYEEEMEGRRELEMKGVYIKGERV